MTTWTRILMGGASALVLRLGSAPAFAQEAPQLPPESSRPAPA